ncbi:MAG: radical SAM protein [Bacteroidales bacterium]|nr:radical SAM protein [Bacteroidales bacterium]
MACGLCPRRCSVDRSSEKGFCGVKGINIARVGLHEWEEPCISGTHGSGTIFFSGCNLRCVFCQNQAISRSDYGRDISVDTLGSVMLYLQDIGAENINLVSPTHFSDKIAETLSQYKPKLRIPVLYNSNGYESVDQLKRLEGLIDIYLPDLKYADNALAKEFSAAPEYFEVATACIREMKRQRPKNVFVNGMLRRGVIVRHLVLPGCIENSKRVLDYLAEFDRNIYVSVMAQYFPIESVKKHKVLNRTLLQTEYDEICEYFRKTGLHNGYFQELSSNSEAYVPDWSLDKLDKILSKI